MKLITAGAEAKLVEELTSLKGQESRWSTVYFHFNHLLEHYRSDYQIKIATNLLVDLLKRQQGAMYLLKDSSLLILGNDIPDQLLEKAIFQLRYLFMDDPLAYSSDGHENKAFCTIDALEESYDNIAAMARRKMLGGRDPAQDSAQSAGKTTAASSVEQSLQSSYFNASNLLAVEELVRNIDIAPAIRRQPACATVPNMSVRRVFDELYVNIAHLKKLMQMDVDILSNRWLFKYLTLALDERVLDMLRENPNTYLNSPISVNLNIRTLMSESFAAFDAVLKPSAKVSVVLEIQASDVFEDMYAFISARDSVQKLGYRVCLDGLNHRSFPMVNRELLNVDLIKLQWNANIKSDIYNDENRIVSDVVQKCGANRIVLTRCDNRQAVDYGQALGISLFQGRYLDELIDPMAQTKN